jgi:hypothetical protein
MRLQTLTFGVEDISMSRCHQCGGDGHSPQPPMPRNVPPPVVSTRMIKCAKCGDPLDGHEMFGACFPEAHLGESPPLIVRNGRLVTT